MAKEDYLVNNNFYAGADYGFDPSYNKEWDIGFNYAEAPPTSQFGFTTDPRTANQLKAVSDKLSTGAKTIEITGVSPEVLESIPEQHLTEINRLRKLTGADLTFHGPLVEPTGVTKQGWNESHREQAERQMTSAVRRAYKVNPDGNVVVTFHSSNGLPDPETKVMTEYTDPKTGKKKMIEQIKDYWIVDKASGQFTSITPKPDYFSGEESAFYGSIEDQEKALKKAIDNQNKEQWYKQLFGISYHADQGAKIVKNVLAQGLGKEEISESELNKSLSKSPIIPVYKSFLDGKGGAIDKLENASEIHEQITDIVHGDTYLRDAYQDLQKSFNQAYAVAKENGNQEDLKKLDSFRKEIKGHLGDLQNVERISEFGEVISKGVNILRSIEPPKTFTPLKDFAFDKSSETFANVAFDAYKKFGKNAPIISVENPPAGTGITRADDLKQVIESSREKLRDKLMSDGLSEKNAKREAEKLIGVTWDVGHINMIRKFGYDKSDVVKDTEKISPFVKHVHLSDNFGLEHTELPMGMGNVPTKEMLDLIGQYNKQAKKIVETGGQWFQSFQKTPFNETLRAFGSPIYSMQMGPSWSGVSGTSGGYFSGYGQTLPDQHFSMYGAGFSNLPPELGGQLGGRNRLSGGTPME